MHHDLLVLFLIIFFLLAFHCSELVWAETKKMHTLCLHTFNKSTNSNLSQESKKCFLSILIGDLLGIICVQEIVKTIPVNCKFDGKHFLPVI